MKTSGFEFIHEGIRRSNSTYWINTDIILSRLEVDELDIYHTIGKNGHINDLLMW